MKLKFNPNLTYQNEAINSVLNLFDGFNLMTSSFLFSNDESSKYYDYGCVRNYISINNWKETLKRNLKNVQLNNRIEISEFNHDLPIFDIEMETGTGKTYVFLKTILELNKKYNFKKFIIIVPSVAIKEGVKKTLEITRNHFNSLFETTYDFFEYKSDNLDSLKDFNQNNNVQIMIINIQSLNKMLSINEKTLNVIYKEMDMFNGDKPIDLIKQTNPIIIIDEPQSTASTKKSLAAIQGMNPLFILRYSATFRERKNEHLIYRLNSIAAYEKNLVKKINYHGINFSHSLNNIECLKIIDFNPKKNTAEIRLNVLINNNEITTKEITVKEKDDLLLISNIDDYKGYLIEEINYENKCISFFNGKKLFFEKNGIHSEILAKQLIKKTIQLHLRKQKYLLKQNVKVLSLFFIDKVSKYRLYDNNIISNGVYANYFEEAFIECANQDEFKEMFVNKDINELAKKIHNGYFSQDIKSKNFKDSKTGDTVDDNLTYELIMKDKEKLLSFNSDLSFIFSHSALKEGWDNPNVFQICILHGMGTEIKRRQEIGRGLRLCVNQNGDRIHDEKINQLSIIGDESYEKFVNYFQKELEEDGIDFHQIDPYIFTNNNLLSNEESLNVFNELKNKKIIDKNNYLNKELSKEEIYNNFVEVFNNLNINCEPKDAIDILNSRNLSIVKNGESQIINPLKNEIISDNNFQKMIKAILQKTKYKFTFNTNDFIDLVVEKIKDSEKEIETIKIIETETNLSVSRSGVVVDKTNNYISSLSDDEQKMMSNFNNNHARSLIHSIKNTTWLTQKTVVEIINKICLLNNKFKKMLFGNIISFQNLLIEKINEAKIELITKNIEYYIWNNHKYSQDDLLLQNTYVYENDMLVNLTTNNKKCPYQYIQCDSYVEKKFANDVLEQNNILFFIKLPLSFKIKTPIGNYSPDWLAFYKTSNNNDVISVIETKGTDNKNQLRFNEKIKIKCADKHFQLLDKHSKDLKIYFNNTNNLKDFLLQIEDENTSN